MARVSNRLISLQHLREINEKTKGLVMQLEIQAEAPPLQQEETEAIRVGDTRVLLELVIRAFKDGSTPEGIVQRYSTLELRDVYATITYYLGHREAIEGYLNERESIANAVRDRIERHQGDLADFRQRLLNRRQFRRE